MPSLLSPGIRRIAFAGLAVWTSAFASETEPEDAAEFEERVEVRAVRDEAAAGPMGSSSTVVDPTEGAGTPSALTDLVTLVPGVSENGQGGMFQVFSIRGVSRQRVTSLISGMRITSERRAGVSTSFVDPTLMSSVDVLRGPSTTFYGSGALGGVVQVAPRSFDGWSYGAGFDSDGDETYQTVGFGDGSWSLGFARRDANDGEAPDGTVRHSGFTQYSAVLRTEWQRGPLRYELLAIPTLAEDIGKANTDFPERTTDYPRERHQLVKFSVESDRGWRTQAFIHAQDLETEVVERDGGQSNVFNDSFDVGLRWEGEREVGKTMFLRYGLDGFGRRDVDADEIQLDPSSPAPAATQSFRSLDGADETELGAFGSVRGHKGKTRWEVGGRLSWQDQANGAAAGNDRRSLNGFVGASRPLGGRLELRGSIASGLRFPSLTELFFSGTTGRGEVIGNPNLDAERSLNTEVSLRWLGRKLLVKGVVFRNRIEDYIERIEVALDELTFVNLDSGTIRGLELQGVARPAEALSISWGGHLIDGEDRSDEPLSDTPPDELYLGAVHRAGPWRSEARITLRADRNDPGDGEKPVPSAELLTASLRYGWSSGWEIVASGSNLLDETYFASADSKAPPAAGRAFAIHLVRRTPR